MVDSYKDDHADVATWLRSSGVAQNTSSLLAAGPNRLDARPGDLFANFTDGSVKAYSAAAGMPFVNLAFDKQYVERNQNGGFVEAHDFKPPDAEWVIVGPGDRKQCLRPNGNKIEETIVGNLLADGQPILFPFRSTALKTGQNLAAETDRLRIEVDGETVRVIGALYRMTSELRRDGSKHWYVPVPTRVALFGEPGGPSLETMRLAKGLRLKIKQEIDERRKANLTALGVTPRSRLGGPSTTFTSGLEPRWSDPKAPQKPSEIDDQIPYA
jgi:hypothetical protein